MYVISLGLLYYFPSLPCTSYHWAFSILSHRTHLVICPCICLTNSLMLPLLTLVCQHNWIVSSHDKILPMCDQPLPLSIHQAPIIYPPAPPIIYPPSTHYLSTSPSHYLSTKHPLSIHQPLPLSIHQPLPLSIHQPLPLSIHQPLPLSIHQPLPLSIHQAPIIYPPSPSHYLSTKSLPLQGAYHFKVPPPNDFRTINPTIITCSTMYHNIQIYIYPNDSCNIF